MSAPERVQGGCYCGDVRFEADLPPKFVAHCHCHNCRRAHGAAFVTWIGFPAEQFAEENAVAVEQESDPVLPDLFFVDQAGVCFFRKDPVPSTGGREDGCGLPLVAAVAVPGTMPMGSVV